VPVLLTEFDVSRRLADGVLGDRRLATQCRLHCDPDSNDARVTTRSAQLITIVHIAVDVLQLYMSVYTTGVDVTKYDPEN